MDLAILMAVVAVIMGVLAIALSYHMLRLAQRHTSEAFRLMNKISRTIDMLDVIFDRLYSNSQAPAAPEESVEAGAAVAASESEAAVEPEEIAAAPEEQGADTGGPGEPTEPTPLPPRAGGEVIDDSQWSRVGDDARRTVRRQRPPEFDRTEIRGESERFPDSPEPLGPFDDRYQGLETEAPGDEQSRESIDRIKDEINDKT